MAGRRHKLLLCQRTRASTCSPWVAAVFTYRRWFFVLSHRREEEEILHGFTARAMASRRSRRRLKSASGLRVVTGDSANRPGSSSSALRGTVRTLAPNQFRTGHVRQPIVTEEKVQVGGPQRVAGAVVLSHCARHAGCARRRDVTVATAPANRAGSSRAACTCHFSLVNRSTLSR